MSIYSSRVMPYVYQLTHKETGQFYFGYREANKIPSNQDLPTYQTSSKKIKEMEFKNFDWMIIAEFFDGNSAYDFENRLIEEHIKNPLCLNKSYTKEGNRKFSIAGRTGYIHSVKSRINMSKGGKGKILSQEHISKLSVAGGRRTHSEITKLKSS